MRRRLAVGVAALAVLVGGCGREAETARAELEATRVAGLFHVVADGERSGFNGFQYRIYEGLDSVDRYVLTPPNDSYERHKLPHEFRRGWSVVVAWNGPSEDGSRECLITAEVPSMAVLPSDLTSEERSKLDPVNQILRVAVSCTLSQHHFDEPSSSD